jgi:hypothetical protein
MIAFVLEDEDEAAEEAPIELARLTKLGPVNDEADMLLTSLFDALGHWKGCTRAVHYQQ